MVAGDAWYSSRDNLKFLKSKKLRFLIAVAKNRKVSIHGIVCPVARTGNPLARFGNIS
jgi:hypothetical protein